MLRAVPGRKSRPLTPLPLPPNVTLLDYHTRNHQLELEDGNLQVICWWYALRGPSSIDSAHRELSRLTPLSRLTQRRASASSRESTRRPQALSWTCSQVATAVAVVAAAGPCCAFWRPFARRLNATRTPQAVCPAPNEGPALLLLLLWCSTTRALSKASSVSWPADISTPRAL